MKYFNTAGPVKRPNHYALDPLSRIDLLGVLAMIDQEKYFVLHAPRQTGKTSMLEALMVRINQVGACRCLYFNVEPAQTARENVGEAMESILGILADQAETDLQDSYLEKRKSALIEEHPAHTLIYHALKDWATASDKPLVLLVDEIDTLIGDSLVSFLRQLRAGYNRRPKAFPLSVVLCGVRDVRDYRIHASSEKEPITGGSAFNIKAGSLRLGNFSRAETQALLQQHTQETGQVFEADAMAAVYALSGGQPWLVNALAYEVTFEMAANRDPKVTLTRSMIETAKERLILRRETHLDQLVDKLQEPRVHRVIAPILAGVAQSTDLRRDDIDYVYDLGLIELKPRLSIANPIYKEVIPRELTYPIQVSLTQEAAWYVDAQTGLLRMDQLMTAFQEFFRRHSQHWTDVYQYKEAGAQLLLQAFLQRVVNGGGRIEREYGLGAGRTDLYLAWTHADGVQDIVLELKLLYGSRQATVKAALPQITAYMDRCGASEGHLVIFDRSEALWEAKIFHDEASFEGRLVQVWGM